MAAKAKLKAAEHKATIHKARKKGLHLSAAQWKAYDRAYKASLKAGDAALAAADRAASKTLALARHRAVINAATLQLRKARLNAAYSIGKKAEAAHSAARTSAIAQAAVKQSFRQSILAHQNTALKARVYADFERHVQQTARLQYAYGGEKAYAHEAVMRTLDTSQAKGVIEARFANAVKTAHAANRSVSPHPKTHHPETAARKAAINKIFSDARAAGLAAARAIPPPPPRKHHRRIRKKKIRTHHHRHHHRRSKTGKQKSSKASRARSKAAHLNAVKAKVALRAVEKATRRAPCPVPLNGHDWGFGDPDGEDCTAAAIANSLLLALAHRLTVDQYADLAFTVEGLCLDNALYALRGEHLWGTGQPYLAHYALADPEQARQISCCRPLPGTVAGFETANGPHAALALSSGWIASWGETLKLAEVIVPGAEIEEAYELLWRWP